MTVTEKYMMTIPELAERIGMSTTFALDLAKKRLSPLKIGRIYLVRRTTYYEYIGSDEYKNHTWCPRPNRRRPTRRMQDGFKTAV